MKQTIVLTIDKILDFCDVPQLFIARDAFDTNYLCLLYEDTPSCKYTAIRISSRRLLSFMNGGEDLRSLFEKPETPNEYFDVEYRENNYHLIPLGVSTIGENRLPSGKYCIIP